MHSLNYITDIYSWRLQNYWEAIKRVGGKKQTLRYFHKKYGMMIFLVYPSFTTKIMEQILNYEELFQKPLKFFHWFLLSIQVACQY